MPMSRALKEATRCSPKNEPKQGRESVSTPKSKQYNHTGKKATGPNYPSKAFGAFQKGKAV